MPGSGESLMSLTSMPLSLPASSSFVSGLVSSADATASARQSGRAIETIRFGVIRRSPTRASRASGVPSILPIKTAPGSVGSAAGVVAAVQLFHALARDVGIDLRGRHVAVAEQQLNDSQVCAVVEQVRRE